MSAPFRTPAVFFRSRVRFDRNELSGALGDIGTVFSLIIGITSASGKDGGAVFTAFGPMQVVTAVSLP
jgi:hypothetical protein